MFEELEFIEVVMSEGDYCYHLDILVGNAAQFRARDGKGIAYAQLQLWDFRYERWREVATNLKSFIKKIKRVNLNKDRTIEEPAEQELFKRNLAALQPHLDQIDEDLEKIGLLRLKNIEFLDNLEKEEKERGRNPDNYRQPNQGTAAAPKPIMRPVDSLKPSHSLNYKMTIPEKDIWKESCLAWFEASGFETCTQPIQVQFLNQVVREEMITAVKNQFTAEHSYRDLVGFVEVEYLKYHTLDNSLSKLLHLRKKPTEKLSLFCEKAIEMGINCQVHLITGEKLVTSILLSQASIQELEGGKLNRADGTPANLQDATPRQVATAFARFEQLKHAQNEHLNCNKINGGRGRKEDKDRPPRPCYICGEVGHFASSCPRKKEDLVCKYPPCKGMTGHVITVCKTKRREEKEK